MPEERSEGPESKETSQPTGATETSDPPAPVPVDQPEEAAAPGVRDAGPAGEEIRDVTPRERKRINRRELLKLVPLVAIGAFAIPKVQGPLLMGGLHFSDWATGKLFGRHRLAPTFSNHEVAAFADFPYNYYDVLDPEVDLERWTLTVEGLVQRPGDYTLA